MKRSLFSITDDRLAHKLVLALTDIIGITSAYYASFHLRNYFFASRGGIYAATTVHAVFLLALLAIVLFVFRHKFLYRELSFSPSSQHLTALTKAWFTLVLIFISLSFFFKVQLFIEHRITVAMFAVIGWMVLYASRFLIVPNLMRSHLKSQAYVHRVIVVGGDEQSLAMADDIYDFNRSHNLLAGYVTRSPLDAAPSEGKAACLGTVGDLSSLIHTHNAQEVFFGPSLFEPNDFANILEQLNSMRVRVRVPISQFGAIRDNVRNLVSGGQNMIVLNEGSFLWVDHFMKRIVDRTGSFFGLILLLPLFAVIAILIKLDSRGPVFFRQKRGGLNGNGFDVLKFRTMTENTEIFHKDAVKQMMTDENMQAQLETGRHLVTKTVDASKVTRVGKYLRKYSLDELPQLINVLRGEMSLIGPRPEPQYQVALYKPWHHIRLLVKPGITGFWQVYGRSAVSHDDMVLMDIYYICNWSFSLDMEILFETPFTLLTGKGAV